MANTIRQDPPHWTHVWGSTNHAGRGRHLKRVLSRARRRAAKLQLQGIPLRYAERGLADKESEVSWRGH